MGGHTLSHRELWKTADIDTLRKEIELLRKKEAAYAALVKELRAEVEAINNERHH
jgi:predicted dithiol-disulfide oxidoreductase (DUF899 family)